MAPAKILKISSLGVGHIASGDFPFLRPTTRKHEPASYCLCVLRCHAIRSGVSILGR